MRCGLSMRVLDRLCRGYEVQVLLLNPRLLHVLIVLSIFLAFVWLALRTLAFGVSV